MVRVGVRVKIRARVRIRVLMLGLRLGLGLASGLGLGQRDLLDLHRLQLRVTEPCGQKHCTRHPRPPTHLCSQPLGSVAKVGVRVRVTVRVRVSVRVRLKVRVRFRGGRGGYPNPSTARGTLALLPICAVNPWGREGG